MTPEEQAVRDAQAEQATLLRELVGHLRADVDKRFDAFSEISRNRADHYDARDEERDAQITSIADSMARIASKIDSFDNRMDAGFVRVYQRIEVLSDQQRSFDRRIAAVEACERKIQEHMSATAHHHVIMDRAKLGLRFMVWIGGAAATVAASISAVLPLFEKYIK